jgi:hypothetical protein
MTDQWRTEGMTRRGAGFSDFVSDTMRNRPEALLLMAAGAALLMTRGRGFGLADLMSAARSAPPVDEGARAMAGAAAQAAPDVRERVGARVEGLRERVSAYAERAAHQVQEDGEALMETAGETIERARSTVQENVNHMLREQPLMLGAMGLLAGVAIGAALPRTLFERDAMRLVREPLRTGLARRAETRSGASGMERSGWESLKGRGGEASQPQPPETQAGSSSRTS